MLLQAGQPWDQHAEKVAQWVRAQGSSSAGADPHSIAAIISVAGSWDGTAVGAPAFADSCARMYRANVEPSLLGATLFDDLNYHRTALLVIVMKGVA